MWVVCFPRRCRLGRRPMTDSESDDGTHERFGHDLLVPRTPLAATGRPTDNANILHLALPLLYAKRGTLHRRWGKGRATFSGGCSTSSTSLAAARAGVHEPRPSTINFDWFMRGNPHPLHSGAGLRRTRLAIFGQRDSSDDQTEWRLTQYVALLLSVQSMRARICGTFAAFRSNPCQLQERASEAARATGAVAICNLVEHGVHDDFLVALRTIRNKSC